MTEVRKEPCSSCPYRRDVPSGVWAYSEYEKLRAYDQGTAAQPMGAFACHATPDHYCHGWAIVHSDRGHEFELLALRMWPTGIPDRVVLLWSSGNEAADHGQADIEEPSQDARKTAERLIRKYKRLQS